MTFSDAVQACRNEGTDVNLASIVDNNEEAFAETLVHGNGDALLWMGLMDDKVKLNPLNPFFTGPGGPCTKSMEVSESRMEWVKMADYLSKLTSFM